MVWCGLSCYSVTCLETCWNRPSNSKNALVFYGHSPVRFYVQFPIVMTSESFLLGVFKMQNFHLLKQPSWPAFLLHESWASVSRVHTETSAQEERRTPNNPTVFGTELLTKQGTKLCQFAQKNKQVLKFSQEISCIIWILLEWITLF